MGKPAPIIGSAATINQQGATIRRQDIIIRTLNEEKSALINLLARALDDMKHHACLTDDTLRVMKRVHSNETESGK